ncbi:MAG: lysine--tRNA ligase, partial [Vicinamibacterales bacterium]
MTHEREPDQLVQRRANFEELVRLGVDPYPRTFERTDTVHALVEAHGTKSAEELEAARPETTTAGRVLAIRSFGKASFLVITDGRAKIQVYIRQDSLPERDFRIFKLLDFGDWVGTAGRVFRTKTNELTIRASRLEFLAKCFVPLPEKWHGLTDVETRYRQRYLDLIVNPDVRRVFEIRSRTLAAIRNFLNARGYLEVETPMLQPVAGGALARPFKTHHNALDMDLFLRIAPELYLKRLTVGGFERVYEINRNFRNEGISTEHNPEFTMLEFYQAYSDYRELMVMTEELISTVACEAIGMEQVTFNDRQISLKPPYRKVSLRQAAAEAAAARLKTTIEERELRQRDTAASLALGLGVELQPGWGAGKIATEIFETLLE